MLQPRPNLSRRKIFQCTIFLSPMPYIKYSIFLLNFYFCDSTTVKNLINLSHYFSTNSLFLLNRTWNYFICVSCVTQSIDFGRQLIYTKQSFYYKSKEISWVQKGFFMSGISKMMQNCEFHVNSLQMQILGNITINKQQYLSFNL